MILKILEGVVGRFERCIFKRNAEGALGRAEN